MDNNKFLLREKNGVEFYVIDSFQETGLVDHMFTSRIGGISDKPFDSLNLGLKTGDKKENVFTNLEKVCQVLDTTVDRIVLSHQVHDTEIRIVDEKDMGKGIIRERDYEGIDGLVTNKPEIVLFTFYADCVPLFYLDKVKRVGGLAHGGWRGTVNKIAGKMIDTMINNFGSNPKDILVGIGPSIGKCCYEVGEDVYTKFNENFTNSENLLNSTNRGTWMLDLWEANRRALEEKGILCRNITVSNLCTSCNNDKFFSYRKESGNTGRMAAAIKLL